MAFQGFGKNSGPSLPPRSQTLFGNNSESPFPTSPFSNPAAPQQPSPRFAVPPPIRNIRPMSPLNDANSQETKWSSPVANFVDARDTGIRFPANPASLHVPKRSRSPPLSHAAEASFANSHLIEGDTERLGIHPNLLFDNGGSKAPRSTWSPPLPLETSRIIEGPRYSSEVAQRPAASPPRWGNQPKFPVHVANSLTYIRPLMDTPYIDAHDTDSNFSTKLANFQAPKRTRSPTLSSAGEVTSKNFHSTQDDAKRFGTQKDLLFDNGASKAPRRMQSPPLAFESNRFVQGHQFPLDEAQRPVISPPRWGSQPKSPADASNSQTPARRSPVVPYADAHDTGPKFPAKSNILDVPKRTRSPPSPSTDEVILRSTHSTQDDTEREIQAKVKRLARFNVELNQPAQSMYDLTKQKISGNRNDRSTEKQKFMVKQPVQEVDLPSSILFDIEAKDASSVVVGLCLEMCPESEREERERKGDLDKYERVGGDRNQTSKSLAVKKYNRTAEREAELIRPLPVLQKTVDYLLSLLDQPYDDKFLGMYNFLWDRMRAIRMDLRMQHIFNWDAITMLEQMIRLHIIAMHELCEYTKGEGFSEGFDAHLNIEQMNKASVELFQLYDDHRKKGSSIPTEKEFRGYYALLKLDKHPGYKVEPAELSLDLAKMTQEIRCTPEILFARDVARACRTGNFIAFFRLARKATYLQACLMHAHFAKLRTQALASLHSGLQSNQGIPIKQVVKWLAMEEEDIGSLLEYHGFSIKQFKDAYMMKEGPFLNSDMDYQTKCSQLVHLKKSKRIMDDVCSGQALSWPGERRNVVLDKVDDFAQKDASPSPTEPETSVDAVDEDMPDFEDDSSPRNNNQVQLVLETPNVLDGENDSETTDLPLDSLVYYPPRVESGTFSESADDALIESSRNTNLRSPRKAIFPQTVTGRLLQIEPSIVEKRVPQVVIRDQESEAMMLRQKDEVAAAKLRLMLRIWKRRSLKQREIRKQHHFAAAAALSSLSLGLPIRRSEVQRSHAADLNFDHVVVERLDRYVKSWSRMNVSEVVAEILGERNPDAKCLCWKLIVSSQTNGSGGHENMQEKHAGHLAGTWMLSKLMGTRNKDDDELVVSSSGLSIWRKWVHRDLICCLSVVRNITFDGNRPFAADDVVAGAGAVLFLVSESIPWELQRTRLHNLVSSLPPGAGLPLLILTSGMHEDEVPDPSLNIINRLGLYDVDRKRVGTSSIVFLAGNRTAENLNGFLSDDSLREGLQWLASQSPVQPVLREVKTRELVLGYLGSSLKVLNSMEISEVGPNHCISAFNDALDRSSEDIVAAADMNPSHWPSPEISLLEFSDERSASNLYLPSIGWSSAVRIESTISMIKGSKLPYFANDLSWLDQGSDMGQEIMNQKSLLEKCLTWYLTQETKMMGEELAAREAYVMLQKGASLEVDGSRYRIVPRWVVIFRRVFNWRLMNLIKGPLSGAYVLDQLNRPSVKTSSPRDTLAALKPGLNESDSSVDTRLAHYVSTDLSLDEVVEVSCSHLFGQPTSAVEAVPPPLSTADKGVTEPWGITNYSPENIEASDASLFNKQSRSSAVVLKSKEADKLSMLLEQCNILQDKIDKKLAIYF